MSPKRRAKPKPKKVAYELIPRDSIVGSPMYGMLDALIAKHHEELSQARIALAWNLSWQPDVDGRVTLGKCKKASDLDRELSVFDFVILLRRGFWRDERVTDHQRRALLDHELMHAAVKYDADGEPVEDERGRPVYRMRRHDVEDFIAVVQRHGLYKTELEQLAVALQQHLPAFKPCVRCGESPGWVAVRDATGRDRVTRCACFNEWATQHSDLLAAM